MKHKKNKNKKKYSWVACVHRDRPECKGRGRVCPHAQPHQFLLEDDMIGCSGECPALGECSYCVPIQGPKVEE